MADDIVYSASLDESEVIRSLENIDREVKKTASTADKNFKQIDKSTQTNAKSLGQTAGATAALTAAFINLGTKAIEVIGETISESIKLAQIQIRAEAQLQAAIRSTGNAAGFTAQQYKQMASDLQSVTNYGDEATIGAEALLLTFKSIGGDVFPRALKSILDVSTAMGQDLRTTTIQVGKALNDPITGLTNLRRVGIQFTDDQEKQIKTLVKANDIMGAQAIILGELESQFGGSAQAARAASGGFEAAQNAIGDLKEVIGKELLPSVTQYNELVIKAAEGWKTGIENVSLLSDAVKEVTGINQVNKDDIEGVNALLLLATDPLEALGIGFERIQKAIEGGITPGANALAQTIVKATVGTEEFAKALDKAAKAREQVDERVPFVPPPVEPTEQPEELEKALKKLSDLEQDYARDRIDIIRKAGQKTIDAEQDAIDKRIDQARSFLRDIEDIEKKNKDAITDSGTDLRRDEEDAQTKYNRKLIELDKDRAKGQIKIEEDYRDQINKIQSQFEFDSEEAARNRDAVTFLRLQRQRDKQIAEARTTRDAKIKENVGENEDKRAQLKQELEYELQDAKLADDRRLEDLQIRLERELEEARQKNSRELDDLMTNERRKQEELDISLERQLNEAQIANDRRVDDYKASLDEEIAALVEAEQKKVEIMQAAVDQRNALQSQIDAIKEREASQGRTSLLGGRAYGGPVGAGQSVIVGDRGRPEIFTPSVAGYVSPQITSPLLGGSTVSNSMTLNNTVNQSMLDPSQQSAMMRAIARFEAVRTLERLTGLR